LSVTVTHHLQKSPSAQRFRHLADKDEAAGSSPARPTTDLDQRKC
jgi:hypothetical protein